MAVHAKISSGLGSGILPPLQAGTRAIEKRVDGFPKVDMKHYLYWMWKWAARDTIKTWKPGDVVVVGGHSMGTYFTGQYCLELAKHRIPVNFAFFMDPTLAPKTICPANVILAYEFWATSGIVEAGRNPALGKGVVTFDGFKGEYKKFVIDKEHVALASDEGVSDLIVNMIAEVIKQSELMR